MDSKRFGGFVLAFLAGALLTGVLITSLPGDHRTGPADPPETTPPANSPPAPGVASAPDSPALDGPVTEEEQAFLKDALLAERARRREQAEDDAVRARERLVRDADGGLTVLDRYLRYGADVTPVVASFDAMSARVRTGEGPVRQIESSGERTTVDLSKTGDETGVLEFGPGVFVLERGGSGWNVKHQNVKSLEIRGAGMDRTTLIGPGWAFLCASDEASIENLTIRDLTIDSVEKGQIVLDARGGIAAVLERVRFAGWEVAGHASTLGVSGKAFLACRDCEFLGNGRGWILSLRGPGLALFERCRFENAGSAVIGNSGSARPAVVRILNCTFERTRLTDRQLRYGDTGGAIVEVRGGQARLGPASWTRDKRVEYFNAAHASSVTGMEFASAPARFGVADAVQALRLAAMSQVGQIVAMEVESISIGGVVEIDFHVLNPKGGERAVVRTRLYGGTSLAEPMEDSRRGGRSTGGITAEQIAALPPLGETLASAPVEGDAEIQRIALRVWNGMGKDGKPVRSLALAVTLVGGGMAWVDAATGEDLLRR